MGSFGPRIRIVVIALAGMALLAPAKKSYENVRREILIDPYWEDSQPASNILPGARVHDREEKARFESRAYVRFAPAEIAKAILAPDMKAINVLKQYAAFERGGQQVTLDPDRLRSYILSAKANPDVTDVLLFDAGYLLFVVLRDEGFQDVIVPLHPEATAPLVAAIKSSGT